MLNAEKYEKQLKEYGSSFALTKDGRLVKCAVCDCCDCCFEKDCIFLKLEWVLEEYEEPVLTKAKIFY